MLALHLSKLLLYYITNEHCYACHHYQKIRNIIARNKEKDGRTFCPLIELTRVQTTSDKSYSLSSKWEIGNECFYQNKQIKRRMG